MDAVARNLASTMFAQFGQTIILRERMTGKYDVTDDTAKVADLEHTVKGIVTGFEALDVRGVVKSGDKKVLVAAKDIERTPTTEWRLKIGSRWYRVVHVKTSYSGDEGCVHQLVARGSDVN